MKPLQVAVSGAGAMGCLFGGLLAEGGADVRLIDVNEEHVKAINDNGLRMVGHGGERTVKVPATLDPSNLPDVDAVFFQCKSYHSVAAASSVAYLFERNPGCLAVSFQNGLGNEGTLASALGEDRVLGGLTAQGALLEGPGVVRNYSMLMTYIGEIKGGASARAESLARSVDEHGLPCKHCEDIRRQMWKKLFANIAHSAPSAITGLSVSGVHEVPELSSTARSAVREALAVANSEGHDIEDKEAFEVFDEIVGPGGTGDIKSSMRIDVVNGRRTEVDQIYGTVIEAGKDSGVPTPVLSTLHALVKGLEHVGEASLGGSSDG